jgi:hypothetical protein
MTHGMPSRYTYIRQEQRKVRIERLVSALALGFANVAISLFGVVALILCLYGTMLIS